MVSPSCPDSAPVPGQAGFSYATCNLFPTDYASTRNAMQTCTDFTLARICSTAAPLCPPGWSLYPLANRCYKASSMFVNNTMLNYTAAASYCESLEGHLVSIHSAAENEFVANLVQVGIGNASSVWIGLIKNNSISTWHDQTPLSYTNAPASAPDGCGFLNSDGSWGVSTACGTQRSFMCRRVPIGRNTSNCECNGQIDDQTRGGVCNFWDGPGSPVSVHVGVFIFIEYA